VRRALALVTVVWLLAAPAAALAQSSPFGPLPQAVEPTATPTAAPSSVDQSDVSRTLLVGIAGVVAVAFLGIGVYIARDARRNLTDDDRRALEGRSTRTAAERHQAEQAKKKARAKGRAQRQARKKQRR
jgi:uncharacterized protein HemX